MTRLQQIREARDKAETALRVSKERLIPINLDEGEQVWLEGRNLKTHHPTTKLAPRRYGPFLVDRKGFPPSEDSWVLESEMSAPDLIADFYESHPNMPRRKPGRRAL